MQDFVVETQFTAKDLVSPVLGKMHNVAKGVTGALKGAGKSFKSISGGVGKFTRDLTIASTPVSLGMRDIIKTGAEFEQSTLNAAAVFGDKLNVYKDSFSALTAEQQKQIKGNEKYTKEFLKLSNTAKAFGESTEYTATQVAEAFKYMGRAGFSLEQAISTVPTALDLATVAQYDLAEATDITMGMLSNFGMMSEDPAIMAKNVKLLSDTMTKAATSARTDLRLLFETFNKGAGIGRLYGADMFDVTAIAGIMARKGYTGEKAGTPIKNLFSRIMSPTKQVWRALETFRVNPGYYKDGKLENKDMFTVLEQIQKRMKKMGGRTAGGALSRLLGMEAGPAVMAMMEIPVKEIKAYREELKNNADVTKRAAEVMRSSTMIAFLKLQSAYTGLKLEIFEKNKDLINETVNGITEWIGKNKELVATNVGGWMETIIKNLDKIVIGFVGLGATKIGLSALADGLTIISTATNLLGDDIGKLTKALKILRIASIGAGKFGLYALAGYGGYQAGSYIDQQINDYQTAKYIESIENRKKMLEEMRKKDRQNAINQGTTLYPSYKQAPVQVQIDISNKTKHNLVGSVRKARNISSTGMMNQSGGWLR